MARQVLIGQQDYTVLIFIPDSASTVGAGKTGLVAANLTAGYTRVETDNDVAHTDGTASLNDLANLTAAHADWGLKEVSSTLCPGVYRLDLPDGMFATGAWSVVLYVMVTTGTASATPMEFELVSFNKQDGVRLGLTALPNAAADAAGGLPISDAGGLDLDARLDAAVSSRASPAQVNTEVLDVLNTDTFAEPGQEAPGATVSLVKKIGYLYKFLRNKITQTSTQLSIYADDGTTVDQKATVSDDATTYTRGEIGTGP